MSNNFDFIQSGYTPGLSYNFNFGVEIAKYFVLKGLNNNFLAVWAESTAGLSSGRMFVGGADTFCVVDLSKTTLVDYYSTTVSGRAREALVASDLADLNAV